MDGPLLLVLCFTNDTTVYAVTFSWRQTVDELQTVFQELQASLYGLNWKYIQKLIGYLGV